jgi:hypothetical protein
MVLIRVFSHWLPSKTVFQIVFDLMLLFFSMLLAAAWLNREASSAVALIAPYALVFALATTAVNKAIGFYHRDAKRGLTQTLALALVSFLLAVAVAYAIFGVLPCSHWGRWWWCAFTRRMGVSVRFWFAV